MEVLRNIQRKLLKQLGLKANNKYRNEKKHLTSPYFGGSCFSYACFMFHASIVSSKITALVDDLGVVCSDM